MPELAEAAENKISRPLYAAVVRILVRSEQPARTLRIACDLSGSLRVFAHPNGNELIPLSNEDYPFEAHIEDVLRRQSRRSGIAHGKVLRKICLRIAETVLGLCRDQAATVSAERT